MTHNGATQVAHRSSLPQPTSAHQTLLRQAITADGAILHVPTSILPCLSSSRLPNIAPALSPSHTAGCLVEREEG
uniref:Uncharacterized protein n=1 Tax=Brassica oleracea TaxID=3712 RepID=A0A3P6CC28_BRAOL|nr:unnamed protein product [Brassica oleracea]